MKEVLRISVEEVTPSIEAILIAQGLTDVSHADGRIVSLAETARDEFAELARPSGIIAEISKEEFRSVYAGEGNNDRDAPLESIYPSSYNLALFAVTVGEPICESIRLQFERNEFPAGSMLDSAASEGAELAALVAERYYTSIVFSEKGIGASHGAMRFSPGYCGWHISAQRRLFEFLKPGEIGIDLNDSFLMTPLKSVSGVIVTGDRSIFVFDDIFEFCADCEDRSCRDRIKALLESDYR
jgi:hypothetical protein